MLELSQGVMGHTAVLDLGPSAWVRFMALVSFGVDRFDVLRTRFPSESHAIAQTPEVEAVNHCGTGYYAFGTRASSRDIRATQWAILALTYIEKAKET